MIIDDEVLPRRIPPPREAMLLDALTVVLVAGCAAIFLTPPPEARGQPPIPLTLPEQRSIRVRDVGELPSARLPETFPPLTVSDVRRDDEQVEFPVQYLSLDEAIQIGLANSRVVRVLAGVTAAASGSTIFDPAVTNTQVDQARAAEIEQQLMEKLERWEALEAKAKAAATQ